MAPASDRLLAEAVAELVLTPAGVAPPAAAARSYLGDGRCVSWPPPGLPAGARHAVDAELLTQPVPHALGRWTGEQGEPFLRRWTRVEVSCKLRDIPITVWLRTRGWQEDSDAYLTTFVLDDIVVTCGVLVPDGTRYADCAVRRREPQ